MKIKSLWRTPIRAFFRDLNNRHFMLIGSAIVIAVAGVTAVDMFTDRVRQGLAMQSSALLAADAAIVSNEEIDPNHLAIANRLGLNTTTFVAMRSVIAFNDKLQLSELKAVNEKYPLRGKLLLAKAPFAQPYVYHSVPDRGTVWVESRLLNQLGAAMGDRVQIGAASLEISRVLVLEPDRGGDLFNIAPRVMMNAQDLDATALIVPGSRYRRALLIAGETNVVNRFQDEISLGSGYRLISPENARPEIKTALQRAHQYLGLATLTTILLAGVAIALAARSFVAENKDTVALLRTLGASRRYILFYYLVELSLLGACAGIIGALIGAGGQEIIARSMTGWTQGSLPPPQISAAIRAAGVAFIALAGFALPQLLRLRDIPPVRVLRRDADARPLRKRAVLFYALTAAIFLAPWRTGEWQLTLWVLVGMLLGLIGLIAIVMGISKFIQKTAVHTSFTWRFGVNNVVRRGTLTTIQVAALGVGLSALLVLAIVRNDLLDSWVASLPPDAPNQFLINIQRADIAGIKSFFTDKQLGEPAIYPMIRGRLVAINDRQIGADSYEDPRAQRLVDREFNLSSAATMKPYNQLIAGHWWSGDDRPGQFSVERDIAKRLDINIGDILTYRVAEREISGKVANLRAVQWDSMQVNFFVEAPPALLEDFPATYITSFRLDNDNYQLLRGLVAKFPSVTVIDIAALVDNVRAIMNRSTATIEFVFYFTLIAGALVLIAAIQSTHAERVFESALLKTLGASRGRTVRIMTSEFVIVGAVAGSVAGLVAIGAAWLIANRVLEISYQADPLIIVMGTVIGIASVCSIGFVALRSVLNEPAAGVLRY